MVTVQCRTATTVQQYISMQYMCQAVHARSCSNSGTVCSTYVHGMLVRFSRWNIVCIVDAAIHAGVWSTSLPQDALWAYYKYRYA